jgi:DNA-binding NarL/FixJ family response regulator
MSDNGAPPPLLRVFLVDDHAMFRAGVRAELAGQVTSGLTDTGEPGEPLGIEVVGEASTVADAIRQIKALTPDVVLLDVHMPEGGGRAVLEGTRQDLGPGSSVRFLALSVSDAA